jgi:acyl carrier protein
MNIQNQIKQFIIEEIMFGGRNTQLGEHDPLISSGILDSLGLLRLIAFIEENLGIEVNDGEVAPDNFETLAVMSSFLNNKREVAH